MRNVIHRLHQDNGKRICCQLPPYYLLPCTKRSRRDIRSGEALDGRYSEVKSSPINQRCDPAIVQIRVPVRRMGRGERPGLPARPHQIEGRQMQTA